MTRRPAPPPSRGMPARQPDDPGAPPRPPMDDWDDALCTGRALVFAGVFALVAIVAGVALGDAPSVTPGPGFDTCKTARC